MRPGQAGVQVPMWSEVVREVNGVPVVTRYRSWSVLDAHRAWRRFGGQR